MNLKEEILKFNCFNEQEVSDKELILKYIDVFEDILTRSNELCHFTASAWVLNEEKSKVLMIHHNIYNSWGWIGGHADGESNLLEVAIREVKEETGVSNLKVLCDGIYALQVLGVNSHMKRGKFVSSHIHMDCCFLFQTTESEELVMNKDENTGVKWIDIDKVMNVVNEEHMKPIYKKLIKKISVLDEKEDK